MGLLDDVVLAIQRRLAPGETPLLADEVIPFPWEIDSGAIGVSAKVTKHFQDGTLDRHLYRLERAHVVNGNGSADIKVRPNGDGNRAQIVPKGGGSRVIDMGDIAYLEIENLSATTAIVAGEVLISGEAFRRHGGS